MSSINETINELALLKVNGFIIPKDGTIKEDLPVQVKSGDTVITSTTTEADGWFEATYTLSPGTYINRLSPKVVCGNNDVVIYEDGITVLSCSLSNITATKDIISYADEETTTISATVKDSNDEFVSDVPITFEYYDSSDDLIHSSTGYTNSSGIASSIYTAHGVGDVTVEISANNSLIETYGIWDYNTISLDTYLTTKSDYEYKSIWVAQAGSSSNLSMSGNTATLSATATAHHTKEFTDKKHYILEFNMKAGSSLGYDYGIGIGEDSTSFAGMHFQANTAFFIAKTSSTNNNNNASFNKRYQSYVPVKITRNGYNWNININNGELNKDLVTDLDLANKFFMMKFSWGDMSVKDMVLKC